MMFMDNESDVYRQLKTEGLLFNRENYVYGRPKIMFITMKVMFMDCESNVHGQ